MNNKKIVYLSTKIRNKQKTKIHPIIIKDENYNKMRYVDYNLDQAINKFKNQYKWLIYL